MPDENIIIERNLVYGETDSEKLTAEVYLPSKGDQLPAVILIHGGAYQSGTKDMYREWGPFFSKGWFCVDGHKLPFGCSRDSKLARCK